MTIRRGKPVTLARAPEGEFELFCFGGNGANFAAPVAERLGLAQAYVFKLGPVLSAFGSSVAEICHVYEEWGQDTDAIAERGEARVRRDLEGEGLSEIRVEVEVGDHVTVRGYSPVPVYTPHPRGEHHHETTGDVLAWDELHPGVTVRGPAASRGRWPSRWR